jgi:hypothetical protein
MGVACPKGDSGLKSYCPIVVGGTSVSAITELVFSELKSGIALGFNPEKTEVSSVYVRPTAWPAICYTQAYPPTGLLTPPRHAEPPLISAPPLASGSYLLMMI